VQDRVKPSFVILVPRTLTLRAERQSARMSTITNDGFTRSATESFCTHMATVHGRQRVNVADVLNRMYSAYLFHATE